MDMSQYLEIFIDETKEHLQGLNQSLLQLEQNPQDKSVLNEIFRVAHTLKGMSGTMGFNKMAKLTHDMENVLQALRNDQISVTSKLVDLLFKCLDALESYTENIVNSGEEGGNDYNDIITELNNSIEGKPSQATQAVKPVAVKREVKTEQQMYPTSNFKLNQYEQNVVNKAIGMDMNAYKITVVLNKGCVLKSARSFIIFQTLERYGEIIKSVPTVEDIEDEKFDFEFTVVCITKEAPEVFDKSINGIAEVDKVIVEPLEAMDLKNCPQSTEMPSSEDIQSEDTENPQHEPEKKQEDNKGQSAQMHKAKTGKTVRVDIDRLDVLMNLVSELIIIKTRLEGLEIKDSSQTYGEAIEYLERITTSLHDAVMKVRMVPVEMVFNRFPRMIRDVSRELGKEIQLNMSGEETELDRTVIDEIGDPLIHLLRNSADHGIESKGKRVQAGKPVVGQINLKAYQDGNNVVIEVDDDGQGIDLEKVKKKAIERGLVKKDMANTLSQKDIVDFLFKPSFSTSDNISN
ncbi:MAG TPA: chemotaxis protein CheA, partial [Acetivibrio sp.]|nr:chemotaxis protein CheA [Acetivibrio sp.]